MMEKQDAHQPLSSTNGTPRLGWRRLAIGFAWGLRNTGVLSITVAAALTVGCNPTQEERKLKAGWVTNCVGPEFSRFAQNGAAGPGPARPVFRVNDHLVLAIPGEYGPWSGKIDHEPSTCRKISDLPWLGFIGFQFQGGWSAGYNPKDVPWVDGADPKHVYPDHVVVLVSSQPALPKLSDQESRAAREKYLETERTLDAQAREIREIAGLRCRFPKLGLATYCTNGEPGNPDSLQLNVWPRNASFFEIKAYYFSSKYGGMSVSWQTLTSDVSHWRDIEATMWRLIADWNLLDRKEDQAAAAGFARPAWRR